MIDKPCEGFVQGPIEGGLGIVKGAGSLVKRTVAATFTSMNKISNSLASGVN